MERAVDLNQVLAVLGILMIGTSPEKLLERLCSGDALEFDIPHALLAKLPRNLAVQARTNGTLVTLQLQQKE